MSTWRWRGTVVVVGALAVALLVLFATCQGESVDLVGQYALDYVIREWEDGVLVPETHIRARMWLRPDQTGKVTARAYDLSGGKVKKSRYSEGGGTWEVRKDRLEWTGLSSTGSVMHPFAPFWEIQRDVSGEARLVQGNCVFVKVTELVGYTVKPTTYGHQSFRVDVPRPDIADTFLRLASEVGERGFLILEVPVPLSNTPNLPEGETTTYQWDVYYIQDIPFQRFLELYDAHKAELLSEDLFSFGFGRHKTTDEVLVREGSYLHVMTLAPEKYRAALASLGVLERPTIRPEEPEKRRPRAGTGEALAGLLDTLEAEGLVFHERRTH